MKWNSRLIITMFALLSFQVFAGPGGFQLSEQNASGLGNAYAGTGAIGEDASTGFYNPAALSCLPYPQIALSGVAIDLNEDVKIKSATIAVPQVIPVTGNNREEAGGWAVIPAFHVAIPCRNFVFGLGVTSPWGLVTSYTRSSMSRYLATYSGLATVNIGPTVAYAITDWVSVGVGFDAMYADVTLKQQVPGAVESTIKNEGDSWGYGWNAGVLFNFNCGCTRVGISYRSRIRQGLDGDASLKNGVTPDLTGSLDATLKLPDVYNLSVIQDIGCNWTVLGTIYYTNWSLLDTVTIRYGGTLGQAVPEAELALDFQSTYKLALAVNYCPDDCWKLKAGVAYDESPVRSSRTRTFRLPDNNRYWLAFGAQYRVNDCLIIDAGYSHIFKQETHIDQTNVLGSGVVLNAKADVDGSANLFGLQATWNFV